MKIASGTTLQSSQVFFGIAVEPLAPFVKEAEKIERAAAIEHHPFFAHALANPAALILWATQEAVVTTPFSQALFATLAHIDNVHVRAVLMPVVAGEHGGFEADSGLAPRSHPWLIWRLCKSLGISEDRIKATAAVSEFVNVLFSAIETPMRSLGLLGVGNELLLLAEYEAIYKCFEKHFPDAHYADFLRSNIKEDEGHTMLIERAATALHHMGHSADEYLKGAAIGVSARVTYYDTLLTESVRLAELSKGD